MERLFHGNPSSTTRPEFSEIVQPEALLLLLVVDSYIKSITCALPESIKSISDANSAVDRTNKPVC